MELSARGRELSRANSSQIHTAQSNEKGGPNENGGPAHLTEDEKREVASLRARDREVRAHEAAHKAAAGGHATGGPSFTFQTGPDGNRYAIGGEVSIDTSPVPNDPAATSRKLEQVRRAALAPADPSPTDERVAARAAARAANARTEAALEEATARKVEAEAPEQTRLSDRDRAAERTPELEPPVTNAELRQGGSGPVTTSAAGHDAPALPEGGALPGKTGKAATDLLAKFEVAKMEEPVVKKGSGLSLYA